MCMSFSSYCVEDLMGILARLWEIMSFSSGRFSLNISKLSSFCFFQGGEMSVFPGVLMLNLFTSLIFTSFFPPSFFLLLSFFLAF